MISALLFVSLLLSACGSPRESKQSSRIEIVVIDLKTGEVDRDLPRFSPQEGVHTSTGDRNGGWYVGGYFTRVENERRSGLARLKSDGSLDREFTPDLPKNTYARKLLLHEQVLYVGGDFGVAAIDAQSGNRIWSTPTDGEGVNDLAIGDGVLYAAGNYERIGSEVRSGITALDAETGRLTNWRVHLSNSSGATIASAVEYADGIVYIGGGFTHVDGARRAAGLASFDTRKDISLTEWVPNPRTAPYLYGPYISGGGGLLVSHGQVLLGFGDESRFTAIDARTARPLSWPRRLECCVATIATSGDTVYLGGGTEAEDNIFRVDGTWARNLASVVLPEGKFTNWRPRLGRCVLTDSIAPSGDKVLVTGLFSRKGCAVA